MRAPLLCAVIALLAVLIATPAPAIATGGNSITVADTSEPNSFLFLSMALDASGNPVVSYDFPNSGLKMLHCGNADCTAGNSIASPDTSGDVSVGSSLTLDASGNPVVAYDDATNGSLKVLHCSNANCTSGNTITSPDTVGRDYTLTSLRLDASGKPVVTYDNTTNGTLKVLHCGNATCTAGNSIASPDTAVASSSASLVLDAVGNPLISYWDVTNYDLRVLYCGNATCTAGNSIASPDTAGDVGAGSSLALDASGHPVVSYTDATYNDVKVLHCGNATCTAGNYIASLDTAPTYTSTSLALDASGNPVVSHQTYQPGPSSALTVLHCGNANCSAGNYTTSPDTGSNDTGWKRGNPSSLALDASGNPVVSYEDYTNGYLKVLHCGNPNCGNLPKAVLSPLVGNVRVGASLGSCSGLPEWCFEQHPGSGLHTADGGICSSDDTLAWDSYPLNPPETVPVYAVARGTVVPYAGSGCNSSGYGAVLLQHGSGSNVWWSGYLHMNNIPPALTPGTPVDAGTFLGDISNVGTTDRHLHFVIYTGSNTVDGLVSFNASIIPRLGQSSLTAPASSGTSILDVGDVSPYSLADVIRINPGASNQEDKTIFGFGSLDLSSPLQFNHPAGEPVVIISQSGSVGGITSLTTVALLRDRASAHRSAAFPLAALVLGAVAFAVGVAWCTRMHRGK